MDISPSPLRVLVVDDDPVMRELLMALLSLEGHHVQLAESGAEALQAIAAGPPPDVVLTDLHMPGGLEGRGLAEQLAAARSGPMLLIGMSGNHPAQSDIELFDAFLNKPFPTEGFSAAVEQARLRHASGQGAIATRQAATAHREGVVDEKIFTSLGATLPAAQLRELYELTLRDVRERVIRMQASLAAGDVDQVRREAHAIKGACGMVGAAELRELAAAAEGGSAGSTPPLAEFPAACDRLERILDTRLSDSQAAQTRRA
jgi:CheY-like chemotaxis protein